MIRLFALSIVIVGTFVPALLWAGSVTDTFEVQTIVGEDTTPPTTPTLLTAVPIAATQIDVSWSVATDDYQLDGYTVWRDGIPIATTTLTSFSDTGLTASTTYAYTVRAFDWLRNVSSSSNELSTTTLAAPTIPPPTPVATSSVDDTGGSGRITLRGDFLVTSGTTTTNFRFDTNRPSRYVLRWGRTSSYELGYVTSERYSERHETFVSELMPDTTYFYEVVAFNPANDIPQVLRMGKFTTQSTTVGDFLPNVMRLDAVASRDGVVLSWQNPLHDTPYRIRVVRSHLGYPADVHDGIVVYQGSAERFVDGSAFTVHPTIYYTVFVIDENGRFSSGAIVIAESFRSSGSGATPPATTTVTTPGTPPPDVLLPLLDPALIAIHQGDRSQSFIDTTLTLDGSLPFTISIPVTALPARLKSIVVTLKDPTDHRRSYRFLLRREAAHTHYEATLAPLMVHGISQLTVEIFDFETQVVGRYSKQLTFTTVSTDDEVFVFFPDIFFTTAFKIFSVLVLLTTLCLCLFLFWRRRRRVT